MSYGLKVRFSLNECIAKFYGCEAIAIAIQEDNLYEIKFVNVHKANMANLVQFPMGDGTLEFWHHRLGHLKMKGVRMLQNMVSGMNLGKISCHSSSLLCESCIEGKQYKVAFLIEVRGKRPNL